MSQDFQKMAEELLMRLGYGDGDKHLDLYSAVAAALAQVAGEKEEDLETCQKCERRVPRQYVAVETEDGVYVGMWCVVCHDQKVVAHFRAQLAAAENSAREMREAGDRIMVAAEKVVKEIKAELAALMKDVK